jgi:predicted nucleic acid-binding protein
MHAGIRSQGRSDDLPHLLRLLDAQPTLRRLVERPPKLRLIVDTNVILNDLRWCCRKRSQLTARPSLLEAAHSGIATIYAPTHVQSEVVAHFQEIQQQVGVRIEELHAAWTPYKEVIKWVDPRATTRARRDVSRRTARDPTDAPCVALSIQLGAGVLSNDRDYESFDVTFYKPGVTKALRDHARATVQEIRLKLGATGTMVLAGGLAIAAVNAFRKLSPGAQLACACALLVALAHDGTGRWLRRNGNTLKAAGIDLLDEFAASLNRAQAERSGNPIAQLQPARPQTLADCVAIAVAESVQPMTAKEIARCVLHAGYVTKSKAFDQLVGKYLSRDSRFRRTNGRWDLRTAGSPQPRSR